MRWRRGDGIRSVVLDASYPADADLYAELEELGDRLGLRVPPAIVDRVQDVAGVGA